MQLPKEKTVIRYQGKNTLMENRTILHLDMNAFFASVEQRTNSHLKGKPVFVCGNPEGRTVIISPSYEARAYGVRTGMTICEAKKLCKNPIIGECNPANYVTVSVHLTEIFTQFTPDRKSTRLNSSHQLSS